MNEQAQQTQQAQNREQGNVPLKETFFVPKGIDWICAYLHQAVSVPQPLIDDGTNLSTQAQLGNIFYITLTGNRTLSAPTSPSDWQKVVWVFAQDATGSRTLALDSAFGLGTDISTFVLSTTASKVDYMGAMYNPNSSKWHILATSKGY